MANFSRVNGRSVIIKNKRSNQKLNMDNLYILGSGKYMLYVYFYQDDCTHMCCGFDLNNMYRVYSFATNVDIYTLEDFLNELDQYELYFSLKGVSNIVDGISNTINEVVHNRQENAINLPKQSS